MWHKILVWLNFHSLVVFWGKKKLHLKSEEKTATVVSTTEKLALFKVKLTYFHLV